MNAHDDRLSLLDAITDAVEGEGIDRPIAHLVARRLCGHIQKAAAGCYLYVGTRDPAEVAARRAAIRRDYDGTGACKERLQRQWGVSRATFFRIVKADKRRQNCLMPPCK